MQLIALAIAPGLAICLYIFHRDAYNREPKRNLLLCFVLGALTVYPAAYIESALMPLTGTSVAGIAVRAFLVVALTEELCKYAVVRGYAFNRKSFDEPLDGIVYAVVTSMGFATLENLYYIIQYEQVQAGYQVAIQRMFLAVPAHASFGVMMGYHVGKAKFDPARRITLLITGIAAAVIFHGAYDWFLFLDQSPTLQPYVSDTLMLSGAIVAFFFAIRFSRKHIGLHRQLSQRTHRPEESFSIRKAKPADVSLIRDLSERTWPAAYGAILSAAQLRYMLDLFYSEESLMRQMGEQEFVIAYDGALPVGFASVGVVEPGVYKLHKLYVLPDMQGKGMGKYLIGSLINAIRTRGGRQLRLNVNRHNPAKVFYERMGFTVVGEEDIDIGQGYFMNDFIMEKSLLV